MNDSELSRLKTTTEEEEAHNEEAKQRGGGSYYAEPNNLGVTEDETKQVMGALWCVQCWPAKEYAHLVIEGVSVCVKHFRNEYEKKLPKQP